MVARFAKMFPAQNLELNSQLEDINGPEFLGVENCGSDDCGREMMIPIEQAHMCNRNEDVKVNITECKNSGKLASTVQDFFEDLTESSSSSSFGDTGSGSENDVAASFGDQEVESQMCVDSASSSMCDDWHESFRKRRTTTDHWRRFISPIMLRCKWVELQLIQLQSQAHKYEEELVALNYTKELDFAHLTLDGSNIKSVPISGRMRRNKVMKRKRRERVEEKCDLASYMSNHTLLSYYEKKADHNVDVGLEDCQEVAIGADIENLVETEFTSSVDLWYPVDCYENDKSWEATIQKLTSIQSRVQNLKIRYDKVISENPERFCSVNQLSALEPSDGLIRSDLKSACFSCW